MARFYHRAPRADLRRRNFSLRLRDMRASLLRFSGALLAASLLLASTTAVAQSSEQRAQDLMTDATRQVFLRWREEHSQSDDWGPPEHLVGRDDGNDEDPAPADPAPHGAKEFTYGTTNVLAVDGNGDITTTSGLSWKINGRIGDSPIIGAGLYVDNEIGAAGATGRGEDVIKSCASFYIVMRMREGRTPQEACEDAIELIVDKYRNVNPAFVPPEKFVAINKAGEYGCAWMGIGGLPQMAIRTDEGGSLYEGTALYSP